MRKQLNITEGIFPMPVLMVATYNEDGSVNVMNAAWGTMQERNTVALNLTESHKTVKNIKARGAFTVSIAETFNGLMAIPNLIALFLLSGTVVKLVKDYFARQHK